MTDPYLAIPYMTIALGCHSGAYELVRSATLSLFTSSVFGFSSSSSNALSLAMGFVIVFSYLLMYIYNKLLIFGGPHGALRYSTLGCSELLIIFYLLLSNHDQKLESTNFSKAVVGLLYLFQESFYHFLCTQQWSFLASAIKLSSNKDNDVSWMIGPIGGIASFVGFAAAGSVQLLIKKFDVVSLLLLAAILELVGFVAVERAYQVFGQEGKMSMEAEIDHHKPKQNTKKTDNNNNHSIADRGRALFQRSPLLYSLFCETLSFQALTALMSVQYGSSLKQAIPDDLKRAGSAGSFYAIINGMSGLLQITLIPYLMKSGNVGTAVSWKGSPLVMMLITSFLILHHNEDASTKHFLLSIALGAIKLIDYSVRTSATEKVYLPLDSESRFFGKELIGMFAVKMGRSVASLSLSGLSIINDRAGGSTKFYPMIGFILSFIWASFSFDVGKLSSRAYKNTKIKEM